MIAARAFGEVDGVLHVSVIYNFFFDIQMKIRKGCVTDPCAR